MRKPKRAAELPAGSARICAWGGVQCVFGLLWSSKPPPLLSKAPVAVSWRGMHAELDDNIYAGLTPLSAVIADSLGMVKMHEDWQGATILAVSKPTESLYWAAIFADATPLAQQEITHSDADALVAWVQSTARQGEIERVYATPEVAREVKTAVPVNAFREEEPPGAMLPAFEKRILPRFAGGAAAACLVVAGLTASWSAADRFLASRGADRPSVRMVAHELPVDLFLAGCHDALRQPWPMPPGWETEASGCAFSGMDDPFIRQVPWEGGSAYRSFTLSTEHNGTLARAAAAQILEGWKGWSRIGDTTILLQRPLEARLAPAGAFQTPSPADLQVETEAMFLGLAQYVRAENGVISIMSAASVPTLIRRLIELDRRVPISVKKFSRTGNGLAIEILPRQTVMLPVEPRA